MKIIEKGMNRNKRPSWRWQGTLSGLLLAYEQPKRPSENNRASLHKSVEMGS